MTTKPAIERLDAEPAATRLDALTPDPANRRTHPPRNLDMLADALRAVGPARSIVIDETGEILAGNGVVLAAAAVGLSKMQIVDADGETVIAVRRSGLTPDQKRALALYDNRTAELAEWNWDQIAADAVAGLALDPFWTPDELAAGLPKPAGRTDPDALPEPRATTIQRGDLFELGAHRLLCGDATCAADYARVLRGTRADVCLTDPPYGIGMDYGPGFDDTADAVRALAAQWVPLARAACDAVVFSPGVRQQWWYPEPDWVLCWFYGAGQLLSPWGFNCWQPFLAYGRDPSHGRGSRPDAVDLNVPANAATIPHPCPKPVALWCWLLDRLTFELDTLVLDPFVGSGTPLIAATMRGRRVAAMEINPSYCQVAIDRWEQFTGQRAVKVGDA